MKATDVHPLAADGIYTDFTPTQQTEKEFSIRITCHSQLSSINVTNGFLTSYLRRFASYRLLQEIY